MHELCPLYSAELEELDTGRNSCEVTLGVEPQAQYRFTSAAKFMLQRQRFANMR